MQFVERIRGLRAYHIYYFLGSRRHQHLDGLPDALICFVGAFASFSVEEQLKGYFALYCCS